VNEPSAQPDLTPLLSRVRRQQLRAWLSGAACGVAVLSAFSYAGALDPARYAEALPTLLQLLRDALPPNFARWASWGKPLCETLAMSVAGTALSALAALPLAGLSARNISPLRWLGGPARLFLNALRSIPELIWGVAFVAAVGFGPLPGVLALAAHSTGMLGKFFSETFEHVPPGPGDALRSHGVSELGVLRYAVLPQVWPRLLDLIIYRWEHNLRAATTVGAVGAGGLGLEIMTAFQLFEYREAAALLILIYLLVTLADLLGGLLRARLVEKT